MALEFKDYYKILGVDRNADEKAIKQAYRRDAMPLTAWFPPKWGLNGDEPPSPGQDPLLSLLVRRKSSGQAAELPGPAQGALFEADALSSGRKAMVPASRSPSTTPPL